MRDKRGMALLFVGSLGFQIVQIGTYPILLAQILSEIEMDGFTIGLYLAVSWIAILSAGPFVPRLIGTLGYKNLSLCAAVSTLFGLLLTVMSDGATALFLSAILLGLGLIMRWIVCDSLVVHLSPDDQKGRWIGFHEALMGLGIALGPLFFVILNIQQTALFCIFVVVVSQLLLWFVSNASLVEEETAAKGKTLPILGYIVIGLAAAFVAGFIENSSIALLPLFFEPYGMTLVSSVVLVSAFGFGGTLLQPALGALADKTGHGFAQGLCASLIVISCGLALLIVQSQAALLVTLFVMGGAVGGLNTLAVIQAGQTLSAHEIPAAMTAIAIAYTIGSVTGPIVAGFLLNLEYPGAMMFGFAVAAFALSIFLLALQRRGYS